MAISTSISRMAVETEVCRGHQRRKFSRPQGKENGQNTVMVDIEVVVRLPVVTAVRDVEVNEYPGVGTLCPCLQG